MSKPFVWQELFVQSKDSTEYELLSNQHVTVTELDGEEVIKVAPEALTLLAQQAFYEASFFLRAGHLKQIASILHDPQASGNDKYVALQLLRNAEVSAKGVLPNCQDTGTATIVASKGQHVWTGGDDAEALSKGVYTTFTENNLRYSQNAPLEERMYPASIADVVKKHAQGDHSTLQQYSPDPDAAVPYYRMGVRELEIPYIGRFKYGKRPLAMDLHYDHMHFVGNEGSNFGLTGSGEFSESVEGLKKYQVEAPKYRKEYIDRARLEVASQWEKSEWETMLNQNYKPPTYSVMTRNCQHYFAEVLQQAQKYETREKPLVLP